MSESWRLELAERKISTFTKLHFENQITYGDAILILTAVISALAAQCWPGRNIDAPRFTQLLAGYAPETLTISVPLLMKSFESSNKADLATKLNGHFDRFAPWRTIPIGHSVDLSENDVELLLGDSSFRQEIRKHSYAYLLYDELRCSYSHEFKPGPRIEVHRPTRLHREPCVSYQPYSPGNPAWSEIPLEPYINLIHFDLPWIGEVLRKCSSAVDSIEERLDKNRKHLPLKLPKTWWIKGGPAAICEEPLQTEDS